MRRRVLMTDLMRTPESRRALERMIMLNEGTLDSDPRPYELLQGILGSESSAGQILAGILCCDIEAP